MADVPRVSVLMPVYNGEEYLGEAIESILNQTFRDFEFIIIDDGSTDNSWDILHSYSDERIHLLRNPTNLKLAATLNHGLDLARGEYIARMDADDISCPQRLAEQVSCLDIHPEIGLVSTNFYVIDSAGAIKSGPVLRGSLSSAQVEWELYWGNPIVHPSVMFRAVIARSCGGYPGGYQYYAPEDYALWLRMLADTEIAVLEQPLLYLRKHEQNVTVIHLRAHIDEVISVAQSALADRLGYQPSDRCIRLVRRLPTNGQVSSSEIKKSINLLLDSFQALAARYGSEREDFHEIRRDLARRLLRLMELYGEQNRVQALVTFGHVLHLSPRVALSSRRTLLRALLGRHLIDALRQVTHRITSK